MIVEQWFSVETRSGVKEFLLPVNPAERSGNDETRYAHLEKLAETHGTSIRVSDARIGKPVISGKPLKLFYAVCALGAVIFWGLLIFAKLDHPLLPAGVLTDGNGSPWTMGRLGNMFIFADSAMRQYQKGHRGFAWASGISAVLWLLMAIDDMGQTPAPWSRAESS